MEFKQKTLNILFIIFAILIIVIGIYFRTPILKDYGFFEPDGFYHYSVMKIIVNNNFVIPKYDNLSGWPQHTLIIGEPAGLYYVTLIPYYFLRNYISLYNLMRIIPIVYGVFDIIGAYFLARYLNKSKFFGLLVMLFVALSMGDAARTTGGVYRGDGFVTIYLIGALIFFIEIFRSNSYYKKILFSILASISLALTNFVWNGAPFATAVYLFSYLFVLAFAFVFNDRNLLRDSFFALFSIGLWYLFVKLLFLSQLIAEQPLTGNYFAMLYVLIVIFTIIAYLIADKIEEKEIRAVLTIIVTVIAIIGIGIFLPQFINQVFIENGFVITNSSSFAATIQELQPPSPSFLVGSFSMELFLVPGGIFLYISSIINTTRYAQQAITDIIWIFSLIADLIFLYVNFEDDKPVLKFKINVPMFVLLAYMFATTFLQIHAIRFNSLISIPIAILSAYLLYWAFAHILTDKKINEEQMIIVYVVYGYILIAALFTTLNLLLATILFILLGSISVLLFVKFPYWTGETLLYGTLSIILFALFYNAFIHTAYIPQADFINPSMINAMFWLRNNTPNNSVILTLWPDGSLVNGVADRISVTNSVGAQNATKAYYFAKWLLNESPDLQFLESNINGKPNYLLVRYVWFTEELMGIIQEANLTGKQINQTGLPMPFNFSKVIQKNNYKEWISGIDSINNFDYWIELFLYSNRTMNAYLFLENESNKMIYRSMFSYIEFYNLANANYSIIAQLPFNETNKYTLLIPFQIEFINNEPSIALDNMYAVPYNFTNTNIYKLIFLCNQYQCPMDTNESNIKLNMVYANNDSKIFNISYG